MQTFSEVYGIQNNNQDETKFEDEADFEVEPNLRLQGLGLGPSLRLSPSSNLILKAKCLTNINIDQNNKITSISPTPSSTALNEQKARQTRYFRTLIMIYVETMTD
jgi:hypothetical protein